MTTQTNVVTGCIEHLKGLIDAGVPPVTGKVFNVLSKEDMKDRTKYIVPPYAALWYNGIVPRGGDVQKGLDSDVQITIVACLPGTAVGKLNSTNAASELLDQMRAAMRGQKSPTGHFWRFAGEVPAGEWDAVAVYLQKWVTAFPITSNTVRA